MFAFKIELAKLDFLISHFGLWLFFKNMNFHTPEFVCLPFNVIYILKCIFHGWTWVPKIFKFFIWQQNFQPFETNIVENSPTISITWILDTFNKGMVGVGVRLELVPVFVPITIKRQCEASQKISA